MKKYTAGIFSIMAAIVFGLLFIGFGGMAYTSMGTQGELSAANISISLLFYICMLFTAVFCGYKNANGVLLGISVILFTFLTIGFMCYFGYSTIISRLIPVFYIISAPFVPLIESITYALNLYASADLTMILIPAIIMLTIIVSFFIGRNVNSRASLTVHRGTGSLNEQSGNKLTA